MIKLEKKVIYYLRKKYHHTSTVEKVTFYDMETAEKEFNSLIPRYFINNKDYSMIEEISLYYPTEYGIKCYYKKIDPNLETIETNYNKE